MTEMRSAVRLGDVEPTIGAMLKDRATRFAPSVMLQERVGEDGGRPRFEATTWEQLYLDVARVGASLIALGIAHDDRVAVLSRNRKEMLLLELAVMSIGAVSVPIFSEYPSSQLDYLLNHSGARFLVVCDRAHLDVAMHANASKGLERIFVMEGCPSDSTRVRPFSDLLDGARKGFVATFEARAATVDQRDACLLMYTSGTTGQPKGVVLCHHNILSQQQAVSQLWDMGPNDRFLSYLPWHHSFGGLFERFRALTSGASFAIDDSYGRDLPRLLENFKAIQPTVYFSAPKVYQAIVAEAGRCEIVERQLIHPELKFVFTAAAPLPTDVSDYFKGKGVPVLEGWGLTETSPCCTLTEMNIEREPGLVGLPIPGVTIKLSPEGEVLVKGPNVMLAYYKAPEQTGRMIDADGWLHTGDLGELNANGLRLKGRLDGVFKLTNGEKVSSHTIETSLVNASEFIDAAVVTGPGRPFVSAMIVPSFVKLGAWAQSRQLRFETHAELVALPEVHHLLEAEINRTMADFSPKYARVRTAALVDRDLCMERGELTPSMKVVRGKVVKHYLPAIDAMYFFAERFRLDGTEPTDEELFALNLLRLS